MPALSAQLLMLSEALSCLALTFVARSLCIVYFMCLLICLLLIKFTSNLQWPASQVTGRVTDRSGCHVYRRSEVEKWLV